MVASEIACHAFSGSRGADDDAMNIGLGDCGQFKN